MGDERDWLDALANGIAEARAVAALQLAHVQSQEVVTALRGATTDASPQVALAAQFALWQSGEDVLDVAGMVQACIGADEALQQQIAMIAEQIGAPLVPRLAPLLNEAGTAAQVVLQLLDDIHDDTALACLRDWQPVDDDLLRARADVLADWHDE